MALSSLESGFSSGMESGKHCDKELKAEAWKLSQSCVRVGTRAGSIADTWTCSAVSWASVFSESFNHQGVMWSAQRLASHPEWQHVSQTGRCPQVLQARQFVLVGSHRDTEQEHGSLWGQGLTGALSQVPGQDKLWGGPLCTLAVRLGPRADLAGKRKEQPQFQRGFLLTVTFSWHPRQQEPWLSGSCAYLRDGFLCIRWTSGWAHLSLSQRLEEGLQFQLWA